MGIVGGVNVVSWLYDERRKGRSVLWSEGMGVTSTVA